MFTVIASYRTLPQHVDAVADLLARHAATSEQEPGCIRFLAHQATDDPTRFFLYETYESQEAFEQHRVTDHFAQNIETVLAPLLIEREWHACSPPLFEVSCALTNTGGSVPKGYWVSVYRTISDPEKLAAYDKLARPAVQLGGGRVLSRGSRVVAHDAGIAERTILIEFDSFEQAVATREGEAYQEALAVLSDGVERDFRIIEGIDLTAGR